MTAAQTNKPEGPRYRQAMKHFLACHGFDHIHKSTRSLMCEVARNIAAIEIWRSKLPADELLPARAGVAFPLSEDEMRWHLSYFGLPEKKNPSP